MFYLGEIKQFKLSYKYFHMSKEGFLKRKICAILNIGKDQKVSEMVVIKWYLFETPQASKSTIVRWIIIGIHLLVYWNSVS